MSLFGCGETGLLVKARSHLLPSRVLGLQEHIRDRAEPVIGVVHRPGSDEALTTALMCAESGRRCYVFVPIPRGRTDADDLSSVVSVGAELVGIPASRYASLRALSRARLREMAGRTGYLVPSQEQCAEIVERVAREVPRRPIDAVIIPESPAYLAAGIALGFYRQVSAGHLDMLPELFVHRQNWRRSASRFRREVLRRVPTEARLTASAELVLVGGGPDDGRTPPWTTTPESFRAYRWWCAQDRSARADAVLLWNAG